MVLTRLPSRRPPPTPRTARHPPTAAPTPGHRRARTVYQCDNCNARALGEQRCDDCNTWMRAVGIGGHCPSCDEPVAITELIQGGDR